MKLRIFCDFDGTIAKNDVGNLVFTEFGDAEHWWNLVNEWKQGKINGRDMWRKQAAVSTLNDKDLDTFCANQPIDPTFPDFVRYCESQNIPVYVTSDGMDAYIKRILKHNKLDHLNVRANSMTFDESGKVEINFPYFDRGCNSCGNCKGYHVSSEKRDGETTVYIGDGLSDKHGAEAADIVFAKDSLKNYCTENKIVFFEFENFSDVLKQIKKLDPQAG